VFLTGIKCVARADKYVLEGGGKKADKIRPLLKLMQFVGAVSGGRSVTQVSLNYLISQGRVLLVS
jgi:hypothetical protein